MKGMLTRFQPSVRASSPSEFADPKDMGTTVFSPPQDDKDDPYFSVNCTIASANGLVFKPAPAPSSKG